MFGFAAITGVALQARGALMPSFAEAFSVSPARLGLLIPVATVCYTAVILLVGLTLGRIPIRALFLAGSLGTAGAFVLLGIAPTFGFLAAAIGLRMGVGGLIRGSDRPILSHLYPSGRSRIYNLHTMSWAFGATLGPLLVTGVLWIGDWRLTYFMLAALTVPIAALVWYLDPPTMAAEEPIDLADFTTLLGHNRVLAMILALVLAVGVEATFFTWLPYFGTQFFTRSTANLLLTTYLVAYVPGRLAFSRVSERIRFATLLFWCSIAGAVTLALVILTEPGLLLFGAVFVLGGLVSGMFPTVLAWATDAVPSYSGPVNAIAMTAGQIGFAIVPPVVGLLATTWDISAVLYVPTALLLLLTGFALALRTVDVSG